MTAGPTLEARGLTRRYGAHRAVAGVSLRVPAVVATHSLQVRPGGCFDPG